MASPAVSLPATARPLTPAARDRRFFTAVAAIIAVVVLVGFGPTFYLRPMFNPATPMRTVYYVHGAIFTVWVALFVTQAVLVSARRLDLHKKLGVAGVGVAVLMMVTGYTAAVTSARHGFRGEGLPPPLVFFSVPFFDLLVFPTLVAAGFWMRRSPVAHKRLMLLAMVSILTAAIARLPYVLPLGPLVLNVRSRSSTLTFLGTAIGFFPIRDITKPFVSCSLLVVSCGLDDFDHN